MIKKIMFVIIHKEMIESTHKIFNIYFNMFFFEKRYKGFHGSKQFQVLKGCLLKPVKFIN